MADSSNSTDDRVAEIQRSFIESTVVLPSVGKPQSSEGSGGEAFHIPVNDGNRDVAVPALTGIHLASSSERNPYQAIVTNELEKKDVSKFEDQEGKHDKCSKKCALDVDCSFLENEECDAKMNMNLPVKRAKKPRRRGGKSRNGTNVENFFPTEKREISFQYSRKEMEAMRYEQLDAQKKRWIEVFCGLGPTVAQEYEELAKSDKILPAVDFDPRKQFLEVGEENASESEEDDSDADMCGIQKPALFVTGEPDFDSGPPEDGLEYLRRVRWEASRIPKVTVAKVDKIKEQSVYMLHIPDIVECPQYLLPLKEWEERFLADFADLRLSFSVNADDSCLPEEAAVKESDKSIVVISNADDSCLPGETPEKESDKSVVVISNADDSCYPEEASEKESDKSVVVISNADDSCHPEEASEKGSDKSVVVINNEDDSCLPEASEKESDKVDPSPTLSAILRMDSAARTAMLKRRIKVAEQMEELSRNDSLWLFALCAAVDCPFDADTSAALRSLLRKCASLRAAKTQIDDELIILNILATISGKYFGQLDK